VLAGILITKYPVKRSGRPFHLVGKETNKNGRKQTTATTKGNHGEAGAGGTGTVYIGKIYGIFTGYVPVS
jgi:hypothetical protein